MKPAAFLRSFLALTGSSLLAISYSHAATLYWDGADTGANAQGGAGTWTTGGTNWDDAAFLGANTAWANGDTAVFGGTAGTATIGAGGVTVGGLTFNTTGYTIAAGTNGLTFSSGTNNVWLSAGLNGSPTATITGTVAGTGANMNFVANPGATATTLSYGGTSAGGWTGTTTVGSGFRLEMTGNANNQALLNTSAISLNGGTIAIGSGTTGIDTTRATLNRINDSAAITVNGGGTIAYDVNNSGTNSETVGTLTLASGQFNLTEAYSLSSGSSTFTFSGISRTGATSAINLQAKNTAFSTGGATFMRVAVGGISADTTAGEIVGPWFTTNYSNTANTDYIVYSNGGSGSNYYAIRANIADSAESTWSTAHAATSNYTLTNALASGSTNGRLTATRNINSLRNISGVTNLTSVDATLNTITVTGSAYTDGDVVTFGGTAPGGLANNVVYYVTGASGTTFSVAATSGGAVLDLTSAGTANVAGGITLSTGNNLGTYGILNGTSALLAIGRSGTGVVTLPSAASDNLYVTSGSAGIAINAPITNNGAGVLTLVKNGGSTLFLTGANTYTGGTVINSGNITISAAAGWVASQNLTFGGTGSLAASVGTLAGGTLTANQGATGTITGTGSLTFTSTSGAGQIIYGGGSSATLNLGNASGFTGNAVLSIGIGGTNPRPTLRFSSMADTAGSYIGWGAGGQADSNQRAQIELNDNGGALTFDNRQLVNLPRTASNNAAKSLILGNNNSTVAHKWVINTDFLNQADRGGQGLILEGGNAGDNAFNGVIGNSTLNGAAMNVYKTGAGKWILGGNNTFTGRLIAGQGTLSVGTLNEVGVAGPLGMNNNIQLGGDERTGVGASAIELRLVGSNSGTLEYTGGNVTSSRSFFIGDNVAANTGGGTIANNGTGAITFSAATFNPTQAGITASRTLILSGSYTATANEVQGAIQDNVSATGKVAVTVSGSGAWTLAGNNTHDGVTQVASSATMTLSGDNSLAGGGVTLNTAGTGATTPRLNLNSATALGTGTLNFGGGAATDTVRLDNTSAGLVTVSTSNVFTMNRNFTFIGTQNLDLGNMTTTLGGMTTGSARGITVTANTLTLGGAIGEGVANLGITKAGAGTLLLNGTNTYTGLTSVNDGTLGGTGTIAGAVTVAASGNLAPGASVGTLTINNNLTVSAMAGGTGVMTYELGPIATSDKIAITGTLDIGAGALGFNNFSFSNAGGLQNGTYKLITSGAAVTGTLDGANLTGAVGTGTGTLQITGNDLELVVTGIGAGTAYDTWEAINAPTTGNNPAADEDGDGVSNGLEFVLGGTIGTNDLSKLPDIATSGGNMTFTFDRAVASIDGTTSAVIQVGTDLVSWPNSYTVGANTAGSSLGVVVAEDTSLGFDTVTLTVPQAPDTKKFGRLKVVVTP